MKKKKQNWKLIEVKVYHIHKLFLFVCCFFSNFEDNDCSSNIFSYSVQITIRGIFHSKSFHSLGQITKVHFSTIQSHFHHQFKGRDYWTACWPKGNWFVIFSLSSSISPSNIWFFFLQFRTVMNHRISYGLFRLKLIERFNENWFQWENKMKINANKFLLMKY